MIDPKALAALQEAAALIEADVSVLTPEEARAAAAEARLAEQARLRRPTPEESARAWKSRNREYRRVRSITVREPGEAVEIWSRGVRRRTGGDRPTEAGQRSARVGQTAEEQVVAKVRLARELLAEGERLEDAIRAWPLPMTFYDPVPPLCDVEVELLAAAAPPGDGEAADDGKTPPPREDRLLPGMVRR